MRRARLSLGSVAASTVALATLAALGALGAMTAAGGGCIPHPDGDFEDYQERLSKLPKVEVEASTFDAELPTQSVEGLYYGACLVELGYGNPNNVFSFYTLTKFSSNEAGSQLTLSIQPLQLGGSPKGPPPTVSKAGTVGEVLQSPATPVAANGRFTLQLGRATVPGTANNISGSDAVILDTTLDGRFSEGRFCGRLGGEVIQPAPAARTLKPELNICQFAAIKDGDKTPEFTVADFQAASCPLD